MMSCYDFKPRKVDGSVPGFRCLDRETVNVIRPTVIAGNIVTKYPAKNSPYKTCYCNNCRLPALWFDKRIPKQWNKCTHCDTWHIMLVSNFGRVTKKIWNGGDPYPKPIFRL